MTSENQIKRLIQNYEMEYRNFMKIESLPNYKLEFFYLNVDDAEKKGWAACAQYRYDFKTHEHILSICLDLVLVKYIVFHELTHMLDAEMYGKTPEDYMYLSGYTEYHASQVELMVLLGAKDIYSTNFSFSVDDQIKTFPSKMSIAEYLHSRHQLVEELFSRSEFPLDIEMLKSAVAILYNYFGLRSICKMNAIDFTERVNNTAIITKIPSGTFFIVNTFMDGWFNNEKVKLSFGPYSQIIIPLINEYKLA